MALINCPECGKEISDKSASCIGCGNPINKQEVVTIVKEETKDQRRLLCPKCLSKELHTEHKGFSGAKALGGVVLAGGIGLLAGTIGSSDVQITCLECGNKFKAGEAKIEKTEAQSLYLEKRVINLLCQGKEVEAQHLYEKEMKIKTGLLPSAEWSRFHYKIIEKVQNAMTDEQKEAQRKKYEDLRSNKGGCMGIIALLITTVTSLLFIL
ncbi:MAG: hypothetical protein ACRCUJ_07770 [Phocaeicola sp.]